MMRTSSQMPYRRRGDLREMRLGVRPPQNLAARYLRPVEDRSGREPEEFTESQCSVDSAKVT